MTSMLKEHMPKPIKRVARMVGYALFLGKIEDWHALSVVLTATTSREERAAMAWAVLRALPPEDVPDVANTALAGIPTSSSPPIAPLLNHMDEATFWADMAELEAIEAYCFTCFSRMPKARQDAFLDFVQGRHAA